MSSGRGGRDLRRWGTPALSVLMLLTQPGCWLLVPIIEGPANHAPELGEGDPSEGAPLVFDVDPKKPFVVADDEDLGDGDTLEFLWYISGIGIQGGAEPIGGDLVGSTLNLAWDDSYEGRILTVTVYDAAGESDTRSWVIQSVQQ